MILKTALKSQPLHSEGQNGCENNTNILNQTNVSGAVMMPIPLLPLGCWRRPVQCGSVVCTWDV